MTTPAKTPASGPAKRRKHGAASEPSKCPFPACGYDGPDADLEPHVLNDHPPAEQAALVAVKDEAAAR